MSDARGETTEEVDDEIVNRAFGADNRARLLRIYLRDAGEVTPENAWLHVYRLFQWIDRTIGLAHCYDSNHAQPGTAWYPRTLRFHGWLAGHLGCTPLDVKHHIDWLFRHAIADLAGIRELVARQAQQSIQGDYPQPGQDDELIEVLRDGLTGALGQDLSEDEWRRLSLKVHSYIGVEKKRNNLTGEGLEDTLATLIRQLPGAESWEVRNRVLLADIPGFNPQGLEEKRKRVDLALWPKGGGRRILVTSKWSFRADREEQFGNDFAAYVKANAGQPFEHVLVTNEFDGARLKRALTSVAGNDLLFHKVVHVNTDALDIVHGPVYRYSAKALPDAIEQGRLMSLGTWLNSLFG